MKTRYLPLVAFISAVSCAPAFAASSAYVTDSAGNMVTDNYGSCVRSINWTPEAATAACENPVKKVAVIEKSAPKLIQPAPTLLAPSPEPIMGNEQNAYAIDSQGRIVRDGYGYCVRTIDWSKDTAIAQCEGWPEAAPVAVKPKAEASETVMPVNETTPAAFVGFFDTDKSDLKTKAINQLDVYSDFMKTHKNKKVKVTGHTDATGSEAYNQALSERRAKAVKTYLEASGIDGQRIETLGMGESAPVATNKTKAGRAENRRVEIEVIK